MFCRRLAFTVGGVCKQNWARMCSTSMQRSFCCSAIPKDDPIKLSYASYQAVNIQTSGQPLIIIHGLFGSKRNWNSLAKAFSKKGKKVVTVDCRNHGDSDHAECHTYPAMATDIELLMEDLGIEQAVILGHSMGGKIAMNLALTRPELVSKLIVEDISPSVSQSEVSVSFLGYIDAMLKVHFDHSLSMPEVRKDVEQQLLPTFQEKSVRDFVLTNIVQREQQYQWRVNLPVIKRHLQDILSFPVFTNTYDGSTLFIGGSLSKHISERDHPEIKRLFPEASIEYIQGAGHWVHAEKPKEFSKMVLDFCDSYC